MCCILKVTSSRDVKSIVNYTYNDISVSLEGKVAIFVSLEGKVVIFEILLEILQTVKFDILKAQVI